MPSPPAADAERPAATTGGTLAALPRHAQPSAAFVDPEPALPQGHDDVLSAEMVAAWHANGWLLVDGVLPAGLVAAAAADGAAIYPTPSGSNGTAEQLASSGRLRLGDGGNSVSTDFPYNSRALNQVVVHPRMLRAVEQLLATDDIRLTQAGFGAKYGLAAGKSRKDEDGRFPAGGGQPHHMDYGFNTLLVPPARPEAVATITYFTEMDPASEASGDSGATALSPGPMILTDAGGVDHTEPEGVYQTEVLGRFRPGTVLLYRMDFWHRGTPLRVGAVRRTSHIVWRRADAEW